MDTSIEIIYKSYLNSEGVCIDTRKLKPNQMFFALKGPNFNGNLYAKSALESGACVAIIDEKDFFIEGKTILVEDVLSSLQNLANFHRKKLNIPIIGIAGSNGKTTSKELIYSTLSKKFKTFATIGNLNNHIGVPLSLLSVDSSFEIAVLELGANHVKELEFLCKIAEPTHGLITNNGLDHLEGYGSFEGVVQGNSEIYYWLLKNNGLPFVNADDEQMMRMASRFSKIETYGGTQTQIISQNPFIKIKTSSGIEFETNLVGDYNLPNINAALKIASFFGVEEKSATEAISTYAPSNNRSQLVEKGNVKIILDCYNANPSSVELSIKSFAKQSDVNKIVILGDMFELGKYEAMEHQRIATLAESLGFKKVFLCGKAFFEVEVNSNTLKFESRNELEHYLSDNKLENSSLLVKGSRGMAMEKIVEYL